MLKFATFCSGIGSPEQALKELCVPHENVFACEKDKHASRSYLANFSPNQMLQDMTEYDYEDESLYADMVVAGIPCQAFSLAGKRLGELDKRGLLFYDFHRYVKNRQPKAFIIENVKGLLSDNGGKTFQNWIQLLGQSMNLQNFLFTHEDSLMYNLHFEVLNSKDFGVPQNRERVFLIGVRNDLPNTFRFPPGFRLTKRLKDILEPEVDEKYYLSDRMLAGFNTHTETQKAKGNGFKFEPITNTDTEIASCVTARVFKMGVDDNYIKEVGKLNSSQDGRVFDVSGISQCLSSGNNNSPKVLVSKEVRTEEAKAERRATGTNSFRGKEIRFAPSEVMNCLQTSLTNDHLIVACNLPGNNEMRSRVYDSAGISPTVTAKQGGGHEQKTIDQQRIRRLTPLECFRLQGFPDDHFYRCKEVNSDSQLYKQAGNSMTVNVMKELINNLVKVVSCL
ncbi:DNA (cytosine-5-)-methyltransferase [Arcticibacter sp.]|uniref:DNA (cytosine-5-)-methyltransferase n=1 Tax=Arcticibacter sp. TaxID=1872630 RepID=UPI00389105AA